MLLLFIDYSEKRGMIINADGKCISGIIYYLNKL